MATRMPRKRSITSQTTLRRNFGGKEWGGRTFEGGVLAGHYGTTIKQLSLLMLPIPLPAQTPIQDSPLSPVPPQLERGSGHN